MSAQMAGLILMRQDMPCIPWEGRGSEYQMAARDIVAERLTGQTSVWQYVVPDCGTKRCLQELHLRIFRAQRIDYPAAVCIYCGLPGYTKDHLLPVTMTGEAARKFVAVVPACGECNNAIGNRTSHRVTERREEAHKYLRKRYRKVLEIGKRWPAKELAELGPNLRGHIEASMAKREVLVQRLMWPHDPEYDKRAFQKSGFDDPIALELL